MRKSKLKSGDFVVIDKEGYKAKGVDFLLRENLRKSLDNKVLNQEEGQIVFLQSEVADLFFKDGITHVVERDLLIRINKE